MPKNGFQSIASKEDLARMEIADLQQSFLKHVHYTLAKDRYSATKRDYYTAFVFAVRDRMVESWIKTQQDYYKQDRKRIYYISMEFLMGRMLGNSLVNLGLHDVCYKALEELGLDLEELREFEWDAGLGNGGLGRLAACFLDSMATLGLAAYGYGIRYEYGMFAQKIVNGYQVETADTWLRYGNPWENARPENTYSINFFGRIEQVADDKGKIRTRWLDTEEVLAMACDTPIPGWEGKTVNTLRLWTAKTPREFNLEFFNHGDYVRAVEERNRSENISRVLYPSDNVEENQILRLKQQYFLVSATLQDIVRRYRKTHTNFDSFGDKIAIQLNDTHPSLAIAEMMRILVDIEGLEWERAWNLTKSVMAFTNHTLMPEALETWRAGLLGNILPRHLQILYEINQRFLKDVEIRYPGNTDKLRNMSIFEGSGNDKRIRMANLAIIGSHAVNGVSALHTELLRTKVFSDFNEFYPKKFSNKTNGITPRRWLLKANPSLAELITESIGNKWITHLPELKNLEPLADDAEFQNRWSDAKIRRKVKMAEHILWEKGVEISLDSLFDCHVKRMHEYKRQLLNVLRVICTYNQMKNDPNGQYISRTVMFAGKAAPGYFMAKLIIKLINNVAQVINADPDMKGRLKVVFLKDYRVSLAEKLIPAADLSEQISTAGTEASGTGNMKFALNGALTIGTLDGANIEIKTAVGDDNIFIFGLTVDKINELRSSYNPQTYYENQPELKRVIDMIRDGKFSPTEKKLFHPIVASLLQHGDRYFLMADFASYMDCHKRVSQAFLDKKSWVRKSILNVANVGNFSSDETIRKYSNEIWGVPV